MTTDRLVRPGMAFRRSLHRRWAGLTMAVLVAVGACTSGSSPSENTERAGTARAAPDEDRAGLHASEAAATLSNLSGVDQLQGLFDEHHDVPRLVLLLSPT